MARRRIISFSFFCLLIGINASLASTRTEREMLSIAQAQLQQQGGTTRTVQDIRKLAEDSHYAVYGEEGGFVVVSRDDRFEPVLAYSDTQFLPEDTPCGMQWWLKAINEAMKHGTIGSRSNTRSTQNVVEPLCKTDWGQDDPYNFLTPELNGRHTPTGCVATAMSQIMKYFAYPEQGTGKGYYTLESNPSRVTETVNGIYEWDKMQDKYDRSTLTDELRLPVARLMKDAGLATNMTYGNNGSGAFSVVSARGFSYNFKYDSLAIHCYYRDFFDQQEWMNTIYREIGEGRPVLYTGVAPGVGGHAFVFDGYDAEGRIHVNWGWNGSGNGYYDIADLNPLNDRGLPGNEHYNTEQSMVFGFKCQDVPDKDEHYKSLWCTDTAYTLSLNGKILNIESEAIWNYNFLTFYGTFGVYFESQDGTPENNTFIMLSSGDKIGIATFFGINSLNNSVFFNKVPAGNYRVYLASKAYNEEKYQPVRCPGGARCYEMSITADGTTISEAKFMQESTTDGIRGTKAVRPSDGRIYDLRGHGYNAGSARSHGIYIINGKKVIQ